MGGGEQDLKGPDLRVDGVAIDSVREGEPILGHVDGEAALFARVGDELFCVGASCTHYGGPLADGLQVDDTIRCPWHHACFSLRTGAMERPPALHPLPRWAVEVADGVARAGDRLEAPATAEKAQGAPGAGAHPSSVVVVGGGAAAALAARTLREEGYAGPITLISDDEDAPYDRPNASKDFLAGNAPLEWMPLYPDEWWSEHAVQVRLRSRVSRIEPDAHRVVLDDGEAVDYGALLVATGAEPIALRDAGPAADRVHYLRSWADSRRIAEAAEGASSAVVVGSSFIGMEVAAALRARDVDVHVVSLETQPMARVLGEELGGFVRRLHERRGVAFHLGEGKGVSRVEADAVVLQDGERIPCDLVVAGIGVRPRVALLEAAGAEVDDGVLVDARLRTGLPDVWAAGDIARWPDPHSGERIRVEHWVVAERMGRTAARNMLGADEPFDAVPFFWSAHYDEASINYVGHARTWDRAEVEGDIEAKDGLVRFYSGGDLAAVASIYRDRESLEAELAMERGATR